MTKLSALLTCGILLSASGREVILKGQPQNSNGREGGVFTHHLILSPPGVNNLEEHHREH